MPFTDNNEIQLSWGWFLSAGIVLMLLGAIRITGSAAATFITVSILGWVLLISAVIAVVQAIRAPDWTGFLVYVLSALFRGFTGYLLVRYPITESRRQKAESRSAPGTSFCLLPSAFCLSVALYRSAAIETLEKG